jgi:hypothetical protein
MSKPTTFTSLAKAISAGIFRRWMAFIGYTLAVMLLLNTGYLSWGILVFPLWVLLISTHILLANLKSKPASDL